MTEMSSKPSEADTGSTVDTEIVGYDPKTGEPIYDRKQEQELTLAQEIDHIAEHTPKIAEMLRNLAKWHNAG